MKTQHTLILTLNLISANLITTIYAAEEEKPWTGLWFPNNPNEPKPLIAKLFNDNGKIDVCDNARDNLLIDFGGHNHIEESYSCIEKKNLYEPNIHTNPLIIHNNIPHFYKSSEVCMNETIEYDETIPTYGSYRPLWAKFGDYKFLPIQRWMHNLNNGAIVMLYHPCANKYQIEKLKTLVKGCLYRYVITPSTRLSKERPLALVAWSKSLEFSVTDPSIVLDFIKTSALHGPGNNHVNGQYDEMLLESAGIVSDEIDARLCPQL